MAATPPNNADTDSRPADAAQKRVTAPEQRARGRRCAEKTRGIKLPTISIPTVMAPVIGKPAIAASVAIAGLVGITTAATSHNTDVSVAQETLELRDLAADEGEPVQITVSSSGADAAVMEAAETLSVASTVQSENEALEQAATELEELLSKISAKADNTLSADAEVDERGSAAASRSFTRGALADEPAADVEEPSADSSEEPLDIVVQAGSGTEEVATATSVGAGADVFNHLYESDAEEGTQAAVPTDNETYIGRHAAEPTAQETAPEMVIAESSEITDNTVAVPLGTETVAVEVSEATLDDVVKATEKLRELINGETVQVTSAQEIEVDRMQETWDQAKSMAQAAGAYSNGQIPLSSLTQLATSPGHYLRSDAALMFGELNAAFKEAFGRNIGMTDSYRSYSAQVAVKAAKGWLAGTPGTSNHGWGLALDLKGPESQWGTAERNWLVNNASDFGWISPEWANTSKPEPWHWEYAGAEVSSIAGE